MATDTTENKTENHRECIIIGSGPAGLTAALYTARANMHPLVIEGFEAGGQLMQTSEVENYPGFPDGTNGFDLIDMCRRQAERFGTEYASEQVTAVDFSNGPKHSITTNRQTYTADSVIIATGASAKYLGLPNEQRLIGQGVSACATCDGFFFKEKEVAVIGGGDTAMEEATFLTKFCSKVYIIHRRDTLRASKIMVQRATDNEKIEFIWNTVVLDVLGSDHVTGLRIQDVNDNSERELPVEGLFLGIGHHPNTDVFRDHVTCDEQGYVVVQPGTVSTSVAGVFACGDCQDLNYKQAITAAGTGCMAAMDAEKYCENLADQRRSVTN